MTRKAVQTQQKKLAFPKTKGKLTTHLGPRVCPNCGHIVPAVKREREDARKKNVELTDQQLKVLRLVAMGYTAREIGDELNLSRRTAEFHRGAIMNKLGLRSASELTIYALANHLVKL